MNPFLWFLFAIVFPILIAGTLMIIVLSAAGFPVTDWMKKTGSNIPVVSTFIKTDEEKGYEITIERLNKTIDKQKDEIEQLQQMVEDLTFMVSQLEDENLKLENKIESEEQLSNDDEENDETAETESIKKLTSSFRKMNKKRAASIIAELDESLATHVLQELSSDTRGKILEAMDAEKAAVLTQRMLTIEE